MDYRAAFWSLFAVCGLTLALAVVVLPEIVAQEFDRGVAAGRLGRTVVPQNCLAWWFGGDPARADRHLQAACAARSTSR